MIKTGRGLLRAVSYAALTMLIAASVNIYGWGYSGSHINEFTGAGERPPGPEDTTEVTVRKLRVPEDMHPESADVQLYRNGVPYGGPVRLNDQNGWLHTWSGLKTQQGDRWTVDEVAVPPGFVKMIEGSPEHGFTITNYLPYMVPPGTTNPPGITNTPGITNPPGIAAPPGAVNPPGTASPPGTANPPGAVKTPKTGDDGDAKPWLMVITVSAMLLRRILLKKPAAK
ncbi:MAG: Cna B-type domain-containing protein [Oscillospiraceae bacterium]|nr:Cna B-type domain-containing protein [Oscillospiraceae bacterium]